MNTSMIRRVAVAGPVAVIASCLAVSTAAAASSSYAFGGSAYGSTASVGSIARSGPSSSISACTTDTFHRDDHAAALNLGAVGHIGAVVTNIQGTTSHGQPKQTSTSSTAATQLLGGLVQARTVEVAAVSAHSTKGYQLTGSTTIAGLRIGGIPIKATAKPNQRFSIPGVATIVVNAQATYNSYSLHQSVVNGLVVTVLSGNRLGLPAGTVVVGHANAALHSPVHTRPYGSAFASQVNVASVLTSGPSAPTYLPCGGSAGKTITNRTAGVRIGQAVSLGTLSSSGVSTDTSKATTASTQAKAARVNLLNGVVTAESVTAKATATQTGRTLRRTSNGTTVAGLKINGRAVTVSAKPNTKINIAGVGTLWLNRTINSGTQIQVYAIQLHLLTAQAGLKAGTDIDIAGARAGVTNH